MSEKKHLQSDEPENPIKEPNEPFMPEPSPEEPNPYPVIDPIPEPSPEPFPVPPEPIPTFPPVIPILGLALSKLMMNIYELSGYGSYRF